MHVTPAGEEIKVLKKGARENTRKANKAKAAGMELDLPEAFQLTVGLEAEAARQLHEADCLKDTARLQDLHLWKMEKHKDSRKGGSRKYEYWMASWREGTKTKNVHLGSCKKIDYSSALSKARKLKAKFLGVGQDQEEAKVEA